MSSNLETEKNVTVDGAAVSAETGKLKRSLQARHMSMIAIGGAIGTGLFLASGASINTAGPGGALVAYGLIGIMVYFLMTSLGEMATYLPVSGSFEAYATRFVDPAWGFAMGWNYWLNWAVTLASELVAASIVMKFWFPDIPGFYWSAVFLVGLTLLNVLSARAFGESEFWFAGIKVITVLVFLFAGAMLILGVGGTAPGFANWTVGDAPFVGGFAAILSIFMIAGYSFQGTEMVGIAAGESADPEKNVPKAINTVFWRIMIFYIGTLVVIGFVLPYTDENLLQNELHNVAVSPFTTVFKRAGFTAAASLMNAVILTSILSAGNSGIYVSSRMLYSMAKTGKAPQLFAKLNSRGVPVNAIYITVAFGLLAFFAALIGDGAAYIWLLNISGMIGFIVWLGIAACHYRFRRAFLAQGHQLSELKYVAKWFPFGPIFAFVLCMIVIIGQNYNGFLEESVNWYTMLSVYIGIPVLLLAYAGYKYTKKTKLIPLDQVDLSRHED